MNSKQKRKKIGDYDYLDIDSHYLAIYQKLCLIWTLEKKDNISWLHIVN